MEAFELALGETETGGFQPHVPISCYALNVVQNTDGIAVLL